jgi:hypothetical protein
MKTDTTKATADAAEGKLFLGDDWFDPLEAGVRTRIRSFIEELLEAELDVALGRDRYQRPRLAETGVGRRPVVGAGHRHGHRERGLMGTFGRLHEEFKRRIKTQTVLPSAETAAMLFWALLASGQITMRKVDGWQSLAEKPSDQIIDLAA